MTTTYVVELADFNGGVMKYGTRAGSYYVLTVRDNLKEGDSPIDRLEISATRVVFHTESINISGDEFIKDDSTGVYHKVGRVRVKVLIGTDLALWKSKRKIMRTLQASLKNDHETNQVGRGVDHLIKVMNNSDDCEAPYDAAYEAPSCLICGCLKI